MATVYKILEKKGRNLFTISAQSSVFEALKLMVEKNLGALIVVEGKDFLGVFTERDYARKVILKGKTSHDTLVKDILEPDCVVVSAETSIEQCMSLMTGHFVRYLPVFEQGELTGIISIGDVVKFIISEQEFIINQLQEHISGNHY